LFQEFDYKFFVPAKIKESHAKNRIKKLIYNCPEGKVETARKIRLTTKTDAKIIRYTSIIARRAISIPNAIKIGSGTKHTIKIKEIASKISEMIKKIALICLEINTSLVIYLLLNTILKAVTINGIRKR
jgi:hypothetical protein